MDLLHKLYAAKATALAEEEQREPLTEVVARGLARRSDRRGFRAAVEGARGPAIVAEMKRASPSVGLIARNFDAASVAAAYERAGVDAISVLTESDHFLGDIAYLNVAREHSTRPLLRKDFLTTPYQIAQSAAYGADAVLLIVAGLRGGDLSTLLAEAERFALDALVEVHDEEEVAIALDAGATLIGINNRDLRTFETDLGVSEHLLPAIPEGVTVISESGVHDPGDTARLHSLGARGFLVGEALMRSVDPLSFVSQMKEAAVTP